jgi:ssDNA-binding Zn-finger/Zn-ribbon topoisomerase 1
MGVVRCPKCGNKTAIRTARKDDCLYYVCINYPYCRGRVLADEDQDDEFGGDLGQEKPAPEIVDDRPPQRVKPSPPERGAEKTVRAAKKGGRKARADVKPPKRKRKGPIDKTWGDDWDEKIHVPKHAPDRARRHAAPKPEIAPGKDDWDEKIPAPKSAPDRARRPVSPKLEIAPGKKGSPEPQQQIASKADAAPEKKAPPRLRQQRVPQEYLVPEKKRRSIMVIIIAVVIAFLAIDGMIYAAFVLRNQGTPATTSTPTPTTMASQQDATWLEYNS